jgi:hypothetical protein
LQAFILEAPKRVVQIDMADAAALQRESDELRQRLLEADASARQEEVEPMAPALPMQPTPANTNAQVQRPVATPDGMLTDLSVVAAVLGDARSEATVLMRSLRAQQWQGKPSTLNIGSLSAAGSNSGRSNQFISLLFDQINERALAELGDGLLFMERDEWVVGEDYRDEIAYLLDHPNAAEQLAGNTTAPALPDGGNEASSIAPSNVPHLEQADLIPAGWEEFVLQMQPLAWATVAIVVGQAPKGGIMAALNTLARPHQLSANQLIDQVNEIALATVGDNVIDAAASLPVEGQAQGPRVFEDYHEALTTLLQWARAHDQIEENPY